MINIKRYGALALVCLSCFLGGCDTITRHEVLSTIFDGVPSLPPPEQICTEYADKKVAEMRAELAGVKDKAENDAGRTASEHPPYAEKKCDGCHDRSTATGLVLPKDKLCFKCHKDFSQGRYLHGPAATRDCLACHDPHNSSFPSLLKADKAQICFRCHREKRVAAGLHDKVAAQKLICVDCHNPHYGNVQYFLK